MDIAKKGGWPCREMSSVSRGSLMAVVVCLLIMMLASPLMAQTASTGALTGTITDTSGAVVPNVKVTVTSPSTGQERSRTSGGRRLLQHRFAEPR